MTALSIITAPDPRLKVHCAPVDVVDAEVRRTLEDMLDTMYAAHGIGLAAPQVGIQRRMIVVDVAGKDDRPRPIRMVNPQIVGRSDEIRPHEEGCLSLPDQWAEVTRPVAVRVRYLDESGQERSLDADGMLATCIQHEIDHLDGVLFVDHVSALKRNMILRRLQKLKKQGG